jgi:hypothetical protein
MPGELVIQAALAFEKSPVISSSSLKYSANAYTLHIGILYKAVFPDNSLLILKSIMEKELKTCTTACFQKICPDY